MYFYGFKLINNSVFSNLNKNSFIHFPAKNEDLAWETLIKTLEEDCKCENVTLLKVKSSFELVANDKIAKITDLVDYLHKVIGMYGDLPLKVNGAVVIHLSDFFDVDNKKEFLNIDTDF